MDPELLPCRRRQATAGLGIAGLCVVEESRDPAGQDFGGPGHVGRPPPRRGRHDLLPALGRRDAHPRRHDVGHGLVARVPDAGEDRLGGNRHGPGDGLVLESRKICRVLPRREPGR